MRCRDCGYVQMPGPHCKRCGASLQTTVPPSTPASPEKDHKDVPSQEAPAQGDTLHLGSLVEKEHIEQAISEILDPDESLLGAVYGQALAGEGYDAFVRYKGGFGNNYLLVTDKRVIFWARGLFKTSIDAFFYDHISSAEETTRMFFPGEIVLDVKGTKERFRFIPSQDVPKAIQLIREQIRKSKIKGPAAQHEGESIPDQIRKLAELRDSGILTEEEFSAKKTELLKRM